MSRYSASDARFAAFYYRHDLLTWRQQELGVSLQEIARQTGEKFVTVRAVFLGCSTNKKVYPIAKFLGLDWSMVHDLQLKKSDFHLAVISGNGGSQKAG